MSTWMVVVGVWAMFALCVVLFVRGASSRTHHVDDTRDEAASVRGGAEASRAKV
ncbi:conserved hypothetical protein [Burkholderia sp. 8Y]|uniref:hypothetical protein n=1 Tax=Burkholderia sp. 8Y TaxID=2653133 RepID=UPI0012F16343|nr:hypothetical protein [Burkholderia sp. 8Y]VXC56635.1 conserved hypothetical protein [Burkholderia sp. 8Y]